MDRHVTRSHRWQVATVLIAVAALPTVAGAAGVTLNPASVTAGYGGTITVTITGIPTGHTVVVDTFLDEDRNGAIGTNEPLTQRFTVTDGQRTTIGGVRNTNVPGDEDGLANGSIRAVFNFPMVPEVMRFSEQCIYRVSSPTGAFPPVQALFTVTQVASTARVAGRVTSGGAPVPYALVFVISPALDGPAAGVVADASGNFTLAATPGTYQLAALRSGYLFANPLPVTLKTGVTLTQNLSMIAADRTISGRITDAATGTGIAGAQMFSANNRENSLEEGALVTLVFTNADGNFVMPVTAEPEWAVGASEWAAAMGGYLLPEGPVLVDTRAGSVSGVSIRWPKATALIYGTLRDDRGQPVGGIAIEGDDDVYESYSVTDASGHYALGTRGASWRVYGDEDTLAARGYLGQTVFVGLADGDARQADIIVLRTTTPVRGRATDDTGAPLEDVGVTLCPDQGSSCTHALTGVDGSFDLMVVGGAWQIWLDTYDLASRGLLAPQRSLTIVEGQPLTGVELVARRGTAMISGAVRSTAGIPIPGVQVSGYGWFDGIMYLTNAETGGTGAYDLGVFDGNWQVGVSCDDLSARGYLCPTSQQVTVSGANRQQDFVVRSLTCTGDCSGDGDVTIDELITMVNIALGTAGVSTCPPGDADGDGNITIDEVITAVGNSLGGCGGA